MKKHQFFILTMVGMLLPILVNGQPGPGAENRFQNLDLTDQQQEQLQSKRLDFQKKMIQLRSDVKVAELEYAEALRGDTSDKEVNNKFDALASAKDKLASARNEHLLAVRKIVGQENFAKMHGQMRGFARMDGREPHPMMRPDRKHHGKFMMPRHRMFDHD